jgi:uncharacterized membrane-anchored protein
MSKRWLLAIVLAQVLWVVATATTKEIAFERGERVLLATKPVDPRDMLRGDYLTLRFDISDVPRDKVRGDTPADPLGKKVYVALVPAGKFHQIEFASFAAIPASTGRVVMRGTIDDRFAWMRSQQGDNGATKPLQVMYGLERYYVAEGTGNPRGELTAEVSVSAGGEPLLREVFIDGKPYREAMPRQVRP